MASTSSNQRSNASETQDTTYNAAPLADYFFIVGIESSQIYDAKSESTLVPLEDTIDEDYALETGPQQTQRPVSPTSPISPSSPTESKRRSRYSFETRKSIGSIINNAAEQAVSPSNRSSTTIRGINGSNSTMSDEAFEDALKKFAAERDTFLDDIYMASGATLLPSQRRQRARVTRIVPEERSATPPGLKSGIGSVRKRLSAMNSTKRQPSLLSRHASTRTSKRMSSYNAVIPAPTPFHVPQDMHPLKRRYEPGLLDRYPPSSMVDEVKRRSAFPDYVPMFAFPNDVTVVSSDERPRSNWHGFAMTAADNSKLHGICLTVWLPLNHGAADALERQCEQWRRTNMSDEERELASSLGERLSFERAKLSRLLAQLPYATSGSDDREALEDEISAVEEKIGLMADLLRPVRHGAASKIGGLTEGDTGLWMPRSYGVLSRDATLVSFLKEWLKAVVVPMTNGAILRVPASSPKIGVWQPLERYVVNLCVEAPSPIHSITQVEISIRELRLYARREAINELPGSRTTDLYPLFRCLTVPNIITLFEFALAESRIILLSSHTAMLHLACTALTSLLYPFNWAGVLIPVLPARLLQALDAPCPYIAGIERRYDNIELPSDDYCIIDLDDNSVEATAEPVRLPRQQRRKLMSLLQVAAPHHHRYGVPVGPPLYAIETFPNDAFSSESPSIFSAEASPSTLAGYVSASSTTFGGSVPAIRHHSLYNAFLSARLDVQRNIDRPSTSSTGKTQSHSSGQSPPSPVAPSPLGTIPGVPVSRSDSGYALHASLREKRSGQFADGAAYRNSSFGYDRVANLRRPSQTTLGHHSSLSTSTLGHGETSTYAPSMYAQSTLAASTIMPQVMVQTVKDDDNTRWAEGHCLIRHRRNTNSLCSICDDRCDEDIFMCNGCGILVHGKCVFGVHLVCPVAFKPDQVRAAFVRCFASLLYTYRKYLHIASGDRRKAGMYYHFNMEHFIKSKPQEEGAYISMLRETQAFSEFIHERESKRADDPSVKLFDEIILSKRNRGKTSLFSKSLTSFLSDRSDHLWRSASAAPPNGRLTSDVFTRAGRTPAQFDPLLMNEPRSIQGTPRVPQTKARRKPVPSMLGLQTTEFGS